MTLDELITHYRLHLNPFETGELDPSAPDEMYVKVDGFAKESGQIKRLAPTLQPRSLVLVYGPAGCGRSSLVNFIIRNLPAPSAGVNLLRVVGQVRDEQPMNAVWQVLEELRTWMRDNNAFLNQDNLNARYERHIENADDDNPPPIGGSKDIFSDSLTVLRGLGIKPVPVVESVFTYRQIENAAIAFQKADVLLLTTIREDLYNAFANHQYPGFRVKVEALGLAEIQSFLDQRWKYATGNPAAVHPFDPDAIVQVFGGRSWPFRNVADIIREAWERHRLTTAPTVRPPSTVSQATILGSAYDYVMRSGMPAEVQT
jgi:energy-coupling factor transporter ATP-binding protein EcfA2